MVRRRDEDWIHDADWKAYVTHVRTELVPKIRDSGMTLSVVPTDPNDVDVKFAVELGLSIMLNKPIILMVHPGTILPERLQRVADEVVIGDVKDAHVRQDLMDAMKRVEAMLDGEQ